MKNKLILLVDAFSQSGASFNNKHERNLYVEKTREFQYRFLRIFVPDTIVRSNLFIYKQLISNLLPGFFSRTWSVQIGYSQKAIVTSANVTGHRRYGSHTAAAVQGVSPQERSWPSTSAHIVQRFHLRDQDGLHETSRLRIVRR